MNQKLRQDADGIIREAIEAVLPDTAVRNALASFQGGAGKVILIAAGKAAWQMASTAAEVLGRVDAGAVITKYGHVKGPIPGIECMEAGHPVPDEAGFAATRRVLDMVENLTEDDTVLFLLSGGASALFEVPLISGEELQSITNQLLACGADIVEMNTIRKRLSSVKGGRFALACAPAKVFSIVLSDVLGDPLDMIASGPAYPDASTSAQALQIAENAFQGVGHTVVFCGREEGRRLGGMLRAQAESGGKRALIAGGETVVHLTGTGKGGRNQELALAAAPIIAGLSDAALFSVGSDGTDGPTDAAGGYVDGDSLRELDALGIDIDSVLQDNDAYHALQAIGGLIVTGATGTNVNDVAVALCTERL